MSTSRIVDFVVPADDRAKIQESEMRGKYLDLTWERKKAMEY